MAEIDDRPHGARTLHKGSTIVTAKQQPQPQQLFIFVY